MNIYVWLLVCEFVSVSVCVCVRMRVWIIVAKNSCLYEFKWIYQRCALYKRMGIRRCIFIFHYIILFLYV